MKHLALVLLLCACTTDAASRVASTLTVGYGEGTSDIAGPEGGWFDSDGSTVWVEISPLAGLETNETRSHEALLEIAKLQRAPAAEEPFVPAPVPWPEIAPGKCPSPAPTADLAPILSRLERLEGKAGGKPDGAKPAPVKVESFDWEATLYGLAAILAAIIGVWQRARIKSGLDAGVDAAKRMARGTERT